MAGIAGIGCSTAAAGRAPFEEVYGRGIGLAHTLDQALIELYRTFYRTFYRAFSERYRAFIELYRAFIGLSGRRHPPKSTFDQPLIRQIFAGLDSIQSVVP